MTRSDSEQFGYNLWRRYRLTIDEYEELYHRQDGRCAGCGWNGKLVVDHEHLTGDIRGLLCNSCNLAVGLLRNNIVHLEGLISYLNKPPVFTGDMFEGRPNRLVLHLKQTVTLLNDRIAALETPDLPPETP